MTINEKWETIQPKLNQSLIQAVKLGFKFHTMMPVQKVTIPLILKNHDVAVEAQTGSGKTFAFLLPIFHILLQKFKKSNPQQVYSIIIAPTRELAKQILEVATIIQQNLQNNIFKLNSFIGGQNTQIDIQNFNNNGGNILICTPGKLKEILEIDENQEQIQLKMLEILVLDEADRLMENEYINDLRVILEKLPKQRRTCLFSATLSSQQQSDFYKLGMRNPAIVSLKQASTNNQSKSQTFVVPTTLSNQFYILDNRLQKIEFLLNFMLKSKQKKMIVFFNTCAIVDFYQKLFQQLIFLKGLNIFGIHGQMKQKKRTKIIENFFNINQGYLFTTDVVARGIDFQDVGQIVQIDPPQDPNFFIHRIGRTARTGKYGQALVLLEKSEESFVEYLKIKAVEIQELQKDETILSFNLKSDKIKQQADMIMIKDRDFIEKSKRAFISFIRSYKEHDLKYIFEIKNLDIGNVANSFFLLRIPRIKEILGKKIENFQQSETDPNQIKFKDKNQEKQFQAKQQQKQQIIEKNLEINKNLKRKIQESKKDIKNIGGIRRKIKKQQEKEEFEDFQTELNLVKKLKKGKLDLIQFQEKMKEYDPEDLQDIVYTKKTVISMHGHSKKNK